MEGFGKEEDFEWDCAEGPGDSEGSGQTRETPLLFVFAYFLPKCLHNRTAPKPSAVRKSSPYVSLEPIVSQLSLMEAVKHLENS